MKLMKHTPIHHYIKEVLANLPADWVNLTTHRLDIYEEKLAKTQFIDQFEALYEQGISDAQALSELPTAYDYIRLGHPLSSVLEWAIASVNAIDAEDVIAFSSKTAPVLAVLRKNLLDGKNTRILYSGALPSYFDAAAIKEVYGYHFDLKEVSAAELEAITEDKSASTILLAEREEIGEAAMMPAIDFYVNTYADWGSILLVNGVENKEYISEIQHVRRRETIAMTPANCVKALQLFVGEKPSTSTKDTAAHKASVEKSIKEITGVESKPLVASSGLSMQYAIMMGLVDYAGQQYPGKDIKFVVPPNCYGGTNDQSRRVAACLSNVEVVDLPVDAGNDMVQSLDKVLNQIAAQDAIPYIIAEIPTNPRVEVPDLQKLKEVLGKKRHTPNGSMAIEPVFILDQTFCPNVQFLSEGDTLSEGQALSYVSGSKFPSGGKCTAGYAVGNAQTSDLLEKIEKHLHLCDNQATDLQMEILAEQLPSMNERIASAYKNTREFVSFIEEVLPQAKINFVSEELAAAGFTPSVFSLDLPTKGATHEEREAHKRALNLKLINLMITEIPKESKFCVSYGQLKGCYWTIPATSTQGTTKEGDKDYIVRASLSGNMDMERHKVVFKEFVKGL
jgi:cystathionine beta-lyase/cystathionine gamma-synthase